MTTVRMFRHDDVAAPVLTGEVGALAALLRTCLVGTAGVAYDGRLAAGWSEPFAGTGTNVAAFRNASAAGGSGCYVRVDDNGPGSGAAREARVQCYAAMTDVNTGLNDTGVVFVRKSAALSATARKWMLLADEWTAWLYVWDTGDGSSPARDTSLCGFGDYVCVDAASAYRYFVIGRSTESQTTGGAVQAFSHNQQVNYNVSGVPGFLAPAMDGIGAAAECKLASVPPMAGTASEAVGGGRYPAGPHPVTGEYYLAPSPPFVSALELAGRLRGLAIPYFRAIELPHAELVPGSDRWRVARGMVSTSASTLPEFGVALDSVGPWS